MLARNNLNSIESKISEALMSNQIIHEDFMTIMNKERTSSIRIIKSQKDKKINIDLADMQLISKFNKGFIFSLCTVDIFSKYAWVLPLKDKKGVSIVNAFQKFFK